jgi:hypothetical protein
LLLTRVLWYLGAVTGKPSRRNFASLHPLPIRSALGLGSRRRSSRSMTMRAVKAALAVWWLSATCRAEPAQELGTIVEMVPKQQASMNVFGEYGFLAIVLQRTEENNIKPTFVAHSAMEFVRHYRRLPAELQEYGIWLSLTENDPYSAQEKAMLEHLKVLCKKHSLPLFIRVGHDERDWKQFSSSPPERDIHRPKSLPSWSLCISWSPIQKLLVGTWAMPLFVSIDYDDGRPSKTVSDEVVEITFTEDHRYFECNRGQAPVLTGRWCIEENDLILQFETQPKSAKIPWQRREKIAKVTEKEFIFTDGTAEGRWERVP